MSFKQFALDAADDPVVHRSVIQTDETNGVLVAGPQGGVIRSVTIARLEGQSPDEDIRIDILGDQRFGMPCGPVGSNSGAMYVGTCAGKTVHWSVTPQRAKVQITLDATGLTRPTTRLVGTDKEIVVPATVRDQTLAERAGRLTGGLEIPAGPTHNADGTRIVRVPDSDIAGLKDRVARAAVTLAGEIEDHVRKPTSAETELLRAVYGLATADPLYRRVNAKRKP